MANIERFLKGTGQPLEIKADKFTNLLLEAYHRFIGNGSPMPLGGKREDYVKQAYMMNHNVFSVIDWISSKGAAVEWQVFQVKENKAAKGYKTFTKSYSDRNMINAMRYRRKAFEELEGTDIHKILEKPNPYQSRYEYIYENIGFNNLSGISLGYMLWPENGRNKFIPQELWNLPSHLVDPIAGTRQKPLRGFRLRYSPTVELEIPLEAVMVRRRWNPDFNERGEHMMGMSPIQPGANVVRQSNDTAIAAMKLLQNQGAIGVLSADSDAEHMTMDAEATDKLQRLYKQKYGGAQRYGEIIVTGYNLKWQNMGMNAVDMQLNEADTASLRKICNLYQVDSKLFNDGESSTYNNLDIARKNSFIDAVLPQLNSIRDKFNEQIAKPYSNRDGVEYYIDYNIESVPELQEDMNVMAERLEKLDFWTANEQREATGQDRIETPEMDVPRFMLGQVQQQMQEEEEQKYWDDAERIYGYKAD